MSSGGRFADLRLQPHYGASDDRLNDFYIPVLERSLKYDRLVGYWRSSSLAVAASGIGRFIHNAMADGGQMRVIAGAQLTSQDIDAIVAGEPIEDAVTRRLLEGTDDLADLIGQERLRLLAWMAREGVLEIKVGVPTDRDGRPLGPAETDKLFHTKFGIFTDDGGDRIAFVGSVNESALGWQHNHESFSVYRSWHPQIWEEYGQRLVDDFEDHWNATEPLNGWLMLDLPEAVKANLVDKVSDDWLPSIVDPGESMDDARAELKKIADAPVVTPGGGVGLATTPIEPWPHQSQIASRIIDTWPRGYLLADEVGLGKTIETGMVVRELFLSGRAKKILLLVPASVQRQWQEELWEKFCLDVPSYSRGKFIDYSEKVVTPPAGSSPWSAFPIVLASSHLAKRDDRRDQVLESGPWDLVFVDEAHHARRRGVGGKEGANHLLRLLRDMRDHEKWQALVLASATPMQMNTHEIFDLLELFGLPGGWSGGESAFDFYYRQLAEPDPKAREWPRIKQMLSDFLGQEDVEPNRTARRRLQALPGPSRKKIEGVHKMPISGSDIASFSPEERSNLDFWLRANTPIRDRVFRTTRTALREYQRIGLLSPEATIPHRHVSDEMIDFESDVERKLYERIEAYISRYYEAYNREKKTKPLGFIMTVYRRRLTSSLYAIHKSLVRRLDGLTANKSVEDLLDDDDRFALESDIDFEIDEALEKAILQQEEIEELKGFIAELEAAIPHDTKGQDVTQRIKELFLDGRDSVLIFTQFTDTLEWLRDQLRSTYGNEVACYTGKGGSRWDSDRGEWVALGKEEVKELFRTREVKILIGTDAMSEGLNLQTCDQLINYDMPWNFMRVEQRIGRIDRIGGRPHVYVTNYFYRDTVEEQVYSGIKEDAEWFQEVVGPAQPVLGAVESVIHDLAMQAPGRQRDEKLEEELEAVRQAIIEYQERPLTIGDLAGDGVDGDMVEQAVFGLREIETILIRNPLTAPLMHKHPDFEHTYFVEVEGQKHPMTFDRSVYDQNPEIGFMTYGHPVFESLLGTGHG